MLTRIMVWTRILFFLLPLSLIACAHQDYPAAHPLDDFIKIFPGRYDSYAQTQNDIRLGLDEDQRNYRRHSIFRKVDHPAFGETVFLAMRNGIYSQYIYTHHRPGPVREHVETGSVRPLVCSATGYAMLTGDTDDDIGKLVRRTKHEVENDFWKETANAAVEGVRETRAQGYALAVGPSYSSTGGIAVPLPSRGVRRHLCVGVGGPGDVIRERAPEIAPVLRGFVAGLPRSIEDAILGRSALAEAARNA